MQAARRVVRMKPQDSLFLLCDIQQVFKPLIYKMDRLEQTSGYMTRLAKILDVPLIVTEHNKKAFGPLTEAVAKHVDKETSVWFEKTKFSMLTDEVLGAMKAKFAGRQNVVLFGMETHVCIQQTCLELLEHGYDVHLVADGISSQREHDRNVAIHRMTQAGACLTTSESIAFELMRDAKHPQFKQLLPLFKEAKVSEFERL